MHDRQRQDVTQQLAWLRATLDALLAVRWPTDGDQRRAVAAEIFRHELASCGHLPAGTDSFVAAEARLLQLSAEARDDIVTRCLFYASDELVTYLAGKRMPHDAIAREEAVLYVQDRLQRDDFRRIRGFHHDRGAAFKTYLWQVVSNLLLDFLRARQKLNEKTEPASAAIEMPDENLALDLDHEQRELTQLVQWLYAEEPAPRARQHRSLHQRLRPHLDLSSKERVFLKALCQYDLSIGEASALPIFNMSGNEGYRFYYQILEKIVVAFKAAGAVDEVRALLDAEELRLEVVLNGASQSVEIQRVYYLRKADASCTDCHVDCDGRAVAARIGESYSKLKKEFAAHFTAINPTTAISDRVLGQLAFAWNGTGPAEVTIDAIPLTFAVTAANVSRLRERFAKSRERDSYNQNTSSN